MQCGLFKMTGVFGPLGTSIVKCCGLLECHLSCRSSSQSKDPSICAQSGFSHLRPVRCLKSCVPMAVTVAHSCCGAPSPLPLSLRLNLKTLLGASLLRALRHVESRVQADMGVVAAELCGHDLILGFYGSQRWSRGPTYRVREHQVLWVWCALRSTVFRETCCETILAEEGPSFVMKCAEQSLCRRSSRCGPYNMNNMNSLIIYEQYEICD